MCDFTTIATKQVPPAPNKRVNYPLGMVLGSDDLQQEQAYFVGQDRLHDRALHGYGTVCGLNLTPDDSQVRVSPGMAIDPLGRVIRVCKEQCGDVNTWLTGQGNRDLLGSGSGPFSLYVTLCYRECLTDQVPIPGAPCRSEEDTLGYSRITETFSLEFHIKPPDSGEAEVVRSFARLLARIQITDSATAFVDDAEMAELVRGLLVTSPPSSPLGSPIGSPLEGMLPVHPDAAEHVLDIAFRVWVSEVRPELHAQCDQAASASSNAACVLLGEVRFEVTGSNVVATGAGTSPKLTIIQDGRPYLLHTQLLQELALHSFAGEGVGQIDLVGDVMGPQGANMVEGLLGRPLSLKPPLAGQALFFTGADWEAQNPPPVTLSGDASGPAGSTMVGALQGIGVRKTKPTNGQALTFSGGQWGPASAPYTIVAAGIAGIGTSRAPVYGGLVLAQGTDIAGKVVPGSVLVSFKTFRIPAGKSMYLVKVTPVLNAKLQKSLGLVGPTVYFDQFIDPMNPLTKEKGILLWVVDGGKPVALPTLAKMEFVIEIGQYQP